MSAGATRVPPSRPPGALSDRPPPAGPGHRSPTPDPRIGSGDVGGRLSGRSRAIPSKARPEGATETCPIGSARVLLVEREPADAALLERLLLLAGVPSGSVERAESFDQALARLARGTFAAAVVGWGGSVETARSAASFVASVRSGPTPLLPIVAVSVSDGDGGAKAAIAAGVHDCLAAPVKAEELRLSLERHLSGRGSTIQAAGYQGPDRREAGARLRRQSLDRARRS